MMIPEKVPQHLDELKQICENHCYGREIDERSFSDIAFKLLEAKPDALKDAAKFILDLKGQFELTLKYYDTLRDKVNRLIYSMCRDTLPRPYGYSNDNKIALTGCLETAIAKVEAASLSSVTKDTIIDISGIRATLVEALTYIKGTTPKIK
jgi:hypothetical protein